MEFIFEIPFKVLAVPNVKIRKPGWMVRLCFVVMKFIMTGLSVINLIVR